MKTHISISKMIVLILVTVFIVGLGMQSVSHAEDPDIPQIYWLDASYHKIRRANLDGTNIQDIITGLNTRPIGIALDLVDRKMYWKQHADPRRQIPGSIWRANLDGTHIQNLITGLGYVGHIALDLAEKKIYWIDRTEPSGDRFTLKVQCSDLNGRNIQNIITEKEVIARWGPYIALDVEQRKIYWTNRDTIKRANFDGTNIQSVVTASDGDIRFDVFGKKIYYSDAYKIRCVNLDGTNVQDVTIGPVSTNLRVERGKMFWFWYEWDHESDNPMAEFWNANLDGTNKQKIFTLGPEAVSDFALSIPPDSLDLMVDSSQDVDVVSIPDAKLAAAVREALGLGAKAPITKQAMQRLTRLHVDGHGITNIIGLEYAIQLERLNLGNNRISDYGPLARLQKLKRLTLWANGISDLSVLSPLPQLEFLDLNWNQISDVSPLAGFTNLKELWLQGNKLANTSTLFQLRNGTFPSDEEVEVIEERDNLNRTYMLLVFRSLDLKVRINPDAVIFRSANSTVLVKASQRPPMYWIDADAGTLQRLIGDEVENLVPNVKNATSLAVDVTGGKLYWTEKTGGRPGRIRDASFDGTNVKLVKDLTSVAHSIALDTVNGKLYLTNSWGKIQRMNLDGSNFQPNFITNLNAPRHITLDATGGQLYWTEQTDGTTGKIRRANLDGSNVQLVKDLASSPRGLALDTANKKLYLTNAYGKVQRLNVDGSNFQSNLITELDAPTEVSIDVASRKIYWAERGSIRRADFSGANIQDLVTNLGSPGNIVLGISATPPVPTDTPAPSVEPAGDTTADVNQDQKVNKTDLLLVVTALGESPPANPNFDVNADGTVDIADVLLVIEALDDPVAAAAPSFGETLTALDPGQLALQIDILRAESDGSIKYAHAIAFFQNLLASIRPTETQLLANYPNPFNPETWIPYQLAKPSDVRITIYDGRGVVVRQLVLGHQAPGFYTERSRAAYWDGRNALGEGVASGIYFYQLQTDNVSSLRKMLILK